MRPMASALLALSLIQPQTAPEPPPPKLVVRISVELVQVDAIVTDSKGRHVTDLQASDFEIFEDGRRQELTNFAYELLAPESDAGPSAEATTLRSRGLRPDDVRRTIAIVVNDIDLSFADTLVAIDGFRAALVPFSAPSDGCGKRNWLSLSGANEDDHYPSVVRCFVRGLFLLLLVRCSSQDPLRSSGPFSPRHDLDCVRAQ